MMSNAYAQAPLDLPQPADNTTSGVVLLDWPTAAVRLDVAVAAYDQGLGGVRQTAMHADTVQNVLQIKAALEKGWNPTR
jgi:hypothetical protein